MGFKKNNPGCKCCKNCTCLQCSANSNKACCSFLLDIEWSGTPCTDYNGIFELLPTTTPEGCCYYHQFDVGTRTIGYFLKIGDATHFTMTFKDPSGTFATTKVVNHRFRAWAADCTASYSLPFATFTQLACAQALDPATTQHSGQFCNAVHINISCGD